MSATSATSLTGEGALPEGWAQTTLEEVCIVNPGKPPKDLLPANAPVTFVPMPAVDEHLGTITTPQTAAFGKVRSGYTAFREDDVLMAKITPCMENGKAAIAKDLINGLGFGSSEFHVLRSNGAVLPEFVYHFIRREAYRRAAEAEMTGTVGQKRVPRWFVEQSELPLPPLAEQKRIVEKGRQLLARVNATRERLAHLPIILKHLRRALLDAAITGELTAAWRSKMGTTANAKDELEIMLTSTNSRRTPRREADPTEGHEILTESIPDNWGIASLGNLFKFIDYRGKNPKKSPSGKRLIGAKNIKMGYISEEPVEYISNETYKSWMTRGFPKVGDIFFVTEGHTMGFTALNTREDEFALAQRTITLQPWGRLETRCFLFFIMSPLFQRMVTLNATGSAAVGIKAARLQSLPMVVPSFAEQQVIVQVLEMLLTIVNAIEKRVAAATERSEKLIQLILAKAFRGELVPTEAELARREGRSYEPASALLARIRNRKENDLSKRQRIR